MKLLLGMPSPRNIKIVNDNWEKINEDQIIVKHYREWSAYQEIRNYFLEHKEYTHLAICPDDLIITQKDIDILKNDLLEFDYPVLCGISNVNMNETEMIVVIIDSIPTLEKSTRSFNFDHFEDLKEDITQVLHAGFPLQIIKRSIVNMIDFDSDSKLNGGDPDIIGNLDLIFSHRCKELNIPIHCDRRARMIHLRGNEGVINNDVSKRYIKIKSGNMYNFLPGSGRA